MTSILEKELNTIKTELERISSEVPTFLTEEITNKINSIREKKSKISYLSDRMIRTANSNIKSFSGVNPILYWVNKILASLNENAGKEDMILSYEIQKSLLTAALGVDNDSYVNSNTIKHKKDILKKRLISSENILEEVKRQADEKQLEVENYALAFENQLASLSMDKVLEKEESRFEVLNSLLKLGQIFSNTELVDSKKTNKKPRSFSDLSSSVKSFVKKSADAADEFIADFSKLDASLPKFEPELDVEIPKAELNEIEFEFQIPSNGASKVSSSKRSATISTRPSQAKAKDPKDKNDHSPALDGAISKSKKGKKKKNRRKYA